MKFNKLKEGNIVAYVKMYKNNNGMYRVKPIVGIVINISKEDVNDKYPKPGLYMVRAWRYYRKERTFTNKRHYDIVEGHLADLKDIEFTLLFSSPEPLTAVQIEDLLA
jgi:hypothetical protein